MESGLGRRCQGFDRKLESHPTIYSFPTISESTLGQFICALRRIASFTLSGARFLLVLVLLSAVKYLPLPIFTSLNETPGGLSCTVVQKRYDLRSLWVRYCHISVTILFRNLALGSFRFIFLLQTNPLSPYFMRLRLQESGYGPMKGLLCGFDAELSPEGLVRGFMISFSIF